MKKINIIIYLLILLLLLSGCSNNIPCETTDTNDSSGSADLSDIQANEDYLKYDYSIKSIKICGFSDSISSAKHNLEYDVWSQGSFVDSTAQKSINLSIGGIGVEAEYVNTEKRTSEFYKTHTYKDKNNNYFAISEYGKLSRFYLHNFNVSENEKKYTEKECLDIVCKFVLEIQDIDFNDYSIETKYDTEKCSYSFEFKKFVNGLKSADEFTIGVTEFGQIYSFSSWMLGQIPSNATHNFNIEAVTASVTAKLDSEYAEAKKVYSDVKYNNFNYTLTIDEKEQYALICYVDIDCINSYGEYTAVIGERIAFFVQ